jgi:hypothetical protein
VVLDEEAQLGDLHQPLAGDGRDLEAPLPLGEDQPFGGEPVQDLAESAEANAVLAAQCLEPKLPARREAAGEDVVAQARPGLLAERIGRGDRPLSRRNGRRGAVIEAVRTDRVLDAGLDMPPEDGLRAIRVPRQGSVLERRCSSAAASPRKTMATIW